MKIGFIGLGNMGTSVANMIAGNGHDVIGYEHNINVVHEINIKHTNSRFLKGVKLSSNITATNDLCKAIDSQMLFFAIPSAFIRKTIEQFGCSIKKDIIIVNMAKGIEKKTFKTSFQVIGEYFPHAKKVMISGPSIANEFGKGMPTIVNVAGTDKQSAAKVIDIITTNTFKAKQSDDIIGIELGGVLKNIYAVGFGIFDGKGLKSTNFSSLYLTFALKEMTNLGESLGAKKETFYGLSGLGDLVATSLSEHSHNRKLGYYLSTGLSHEEIEKNLGVMPEGYNTLVTVLELANDKKIKMPIAQALFDVIEGRKSAFDFISMIEEF
ncbi:MAG: NAD(P)H-dependent glycerol-3-phosphate dehydrogenase [archaeon]